MLAHWNFFSSHKMILPAYPNSWQFFASVFLKGVGSLGVSEVSESQNHELYYSQRFFWEGLPNILPCLFNYSQYFRLCYIRHTSHWNQHLFRAIVCEDIEIGSMASIAMKRSLSQDDLGGVKTKSSAHPLDHHLLLPLGQERGLKVNFHCISKSDNNNAWPVTRLLPWLHWHYI